MAEVVIAFLPPLDTGVFKDLATKKDEPTIEEFQILWSLEPQEARVLPRLLPLDLHLA